MQTGSGREAGSPGGQAPGSLQVGGGGGTLDQIQPPQYTWAHLKSVRSLGSGLPLLPPSHLPTPFPFFLSWPPSPSTSFLFLFLAPPTPPEAFC